MQRGLSVNPHRQDADKFGGSRDFRQPLHTPLERESLAPRIDRRHSLPTRITALVMTATLAASMVLLWASIETTRGFLRRGIEAELIGSAEAAVATLERWYALRELELGAHGARVIRQSEPVTHATVARVAAESKLASAVLWLSPAGTVLQSSSTAELAGTLPTASGPGAGGILSSADGNVQAVMAPVTDSTGEVRGTLVALIPVARIAEALRLERPAGLGFVSVWDEHGTLLLSSHEGAARRQAAEDGLHVHDADSRLKDPRLQDSGLQVWTAVDGSRWAGATAGLKRFDWRVSVEQPYERVFAPLSGLLGRLLVLHLVVIGFVAGIVFRWIRRLVGPLHTLSAAAQQIAEGDISPQIEEPESKDEIALLVRAFNAMATRVRQTRQELRAGRDKVEAAKTSLRAQNEQLHRANEQLEQLSVTDGLTKLYNHRYFHEHLRREIAGVRRTGATLALILIDIDDFKKLNDRYGHAAGDLVLSRVAHVMTEQVRESDLLARYGGEEFALVTSETDVEGAMSLAEKLRMAVSSAEYVVHDDHAELLRLSVTISVGVSFFRSDTQSLFNEADKALYRAKKMGKDCVVLHQDD